MTGPAISQDVLQFIAEQIDTVPQLECLLLLHEHDGEPWTVEQVATRIYVSQSGTRAILENLQRRGLVASDGDSSRYRFKADGIADSDLMRKVAAEYQRHLVPIATFIHSKASASVREFARAFDLKKDR